MLSPEESRQQRIAIMGSELGNLHFHLCNQLVYLHLKWREYRALFGSGPDQIETLNASAPVFFGVLQRVLFDDVLLHLARLTDPPKSRGNDNLTVQRLAQLVQDTPNLSQEVAAAVTEAKKRCAFARTWRNKALAHLDLSTCTEPSTLPMASRQLVEEALAALRKPLNLLTRYFSNADLSFRLVTHGGGANLLLHYVDLGVKEEKKIRSRFKRSPEHD